MSTISKQLLSGSTNGRPIKVVAVATPGTLIHTAVANATDIDEIWLYACNTDTSDHILTVEFGGVTSPDDHIEMTITADTTMLIVPGAPLNNTLVVRAFAVGAANLVTVFGYVNRIDV